MADSFISAYLAIAFCLFTFVADMGETKISTQDIYDSIQVIIRQNTELRAEVSEIKKNFETQNERFKIIENKVSNLEETNRKLELRLNNVEKKLKRNNVIIFGLYEDNNIPLIELVRKFFVEKLNVSLEQTDLNDAYRIGSKQTNGNQRPVIVELLSKHKKKEVFNNVKLLKNTKYSIADDLSEKERKERKILYEHHVAARTKGYPTKIFRNRLEINGKTYTTRDLQDSALQITSATENVSKVSRISTSAPNTPDIAEPQEVFTFERPTLSTATHSTGNNLTNRKNIATTSVGTRSRSNSKSSQSSDKSTKKSVAH